MMYNVSFFIFVFIFLSNLYGSESRSISEDRSDAELHRSFSTLELGDISDYEEDTLEAASDAFFYWEEREFDLARESLKKAAEARHSYSMPKYAFILLSNDHLAKSCHIIQDIYQAADLLLMAAMRGVEMATEYVAEIDEHAKQLTAQRDQSTGNVCKSMGVLETLKLAPGGKIVQWLKGKFENREKYPSQIQDGLKLFFLSVLPTLDKEVILKLEQEVSKEIKAISDQKDQKLVGRKVTDIHGYAAKGLGLSNKISENPSYTGQSQSQIRGSHNYTYYNTRNKYPQLLDMNMRTLNYVAKGQLLHNDKNDKFVKTQVEPMAAGPVYAKLRNWNPNGNSPRLTGATAFVVDCFYTTFAEFFYGHPLWLVELTHIEEPWKKIDKIVRDKYAGIWPNTLEKWSKDNPEFSKRKILKEMYQQDINNYIKSDESRNSVAYRLFLISLIDHMNKSIMILTDNKEVTIDLRYVSGVLLSSKAEEISQAQTLVILYGASHKIQWIKNIIDFQKLKNIKYSLDTRYNYKDFERFLVKNAKKYNIKLVKDGSSEILNDNAAQLLTQEELHRQVDKEDPLLLDYEQPLLEESNILALDMNDYSRKTIPSQFKALSTSDRIKITNVTKVNQSWIIPALNNNIKLTADSFSYVPKVAHSGKSLEQPPLRKMEKFLETLKAKEQAEELIEKSSESHGRPSFLDGKREREDSRKENWETKKKKKVYASSEINMGNKKRFQDTMDEAKKRKSGKSKLKHERPQKKDKKGKDKEKNKED